MEKKLVVAIDGPAGAGKVPLLNWRLKNWTIFILIQVQCIVL